MNTSIPELSDEQIESMRFAIMSDVDKSARMKTRRYRKVVVGAAAVVAISGIGVGIAGLNNGPAVYDASTASKPAGGNESRTNALAPDQAKSGDKAAPEDSDREIVTTGSVGMTVAKPVVAARKISTWVGTAGGRVDSRSETAPSGDNGGSVHLVIRIPQEKVNSSIDQLRTYGTIEYVNIEDYDATTEGKDLDARIKALRISVDRLEGLMKNSKSTAELIRAESALTERQANLESLVAQRKGLSERASLSALDIDLAAKPMANSVSPSGFWGGVVTGWNSLVATIDGAVHGIGVILPWGVALGLLSGLAWLATRRRSRAS
ncbi:MAG: DUF4349 domain-containing protein [Actinomycetota bacterium]|nr:DUF4349 domain-containing protein [Actinomycetota bacterium]